MSAAALKGRGEHTTVGVAASVSTIRSTASGAAVAGGERLVTCSKLVSARPCRLHLRWTPESQQGSDKETDVRGEGRLTIGILNLVGPRASGGGGWWMLAAIRWETNISSRACAKTGVEGKLTTQKFAQGKLLDFLLLGRWRWLLVLNAKCPPPGDAGVQGRGRGGRGRGRW